MVEEYPDNWPREAIQRIEELEEENAELRATLKEAEHGRD